MSGDSLSQRGSPRRWLTADCEGRAAPLAEISPEDVRALGAARPVARVAVYRASPLFCDAIAVEYELEALRPWIISAARGRGTAHMVQGAGGPQEPRLLLLAVSQLLYHQLMEREPLFVVAVDAERPVRAQRLIRSDAILLRRSGLPPRSAPRMHYEEDRDSRRSERGYADIRGFRRHTAKPDRMLTSWELRQIFAMPAFT